MFFPRGPEPRCQSFRATAKASHEKNSSRSRSAAVGEYLGGALHADGADADGGGWDSGDGAADWLGVGPGACSARSQPANASNVKAAPATR